MDWRANNNVLGTGAYDRGLRATDISIDEQGTGILARGREGITVRAAFIKQTEAEDIGKRALALRTAAGTLTGQAVGARSRNRTSRRSSTTCGPSGRTESRRSTPTGSSRLSPRTGPTCTGRGRRWTPPERPRPCPPR
jgi:hypothetical protein